MKTLFARYLASTLILLFLSHIIFAIGFISLTFNYSVEQIQGMLSDDAEKIADMSAALIENDSDPRVMQMFLTGLQAIVSYSDETVIVCNADGLILYFADEAGLTYGYKSTHLPQYLFDKLYDDGDFYSVGTLGLFYDTQHYTCGKYILGGTDGEIIGSVFVSAPTDSVMELIENSLQIFYIITAVVLTLGIVISYFLARSMSKPLRQISQAAHDFAHGDFDVRVPEGRTDEIGELAHNFNSMCDAISKLEQMRASFIANISHELKTPMTTIAGFADGILDGVIPPEKEREYLQIISNDTKRLSRLVVRMLEASRISSGEIVMHPGVFEMNEMIRRTLLEMEQRIESRNLTVNVRFEQDAFYVNADGDYIAQVVYNLMDNACKYAETGGFIDLQTQKAGAKVRVTIANSGRDIPSAQLRYIFDRFYKVDQSRGMDANSAGLGLFLVKTILSMHGEEISVTSENGVTAFSFMLPAAENPAAGKHALPGGGKYEFVDEP